jgi:hypothetical protein
VKSKVRWVPAKATLGQTQATLGQAPAQNQYITERLQVPAESATSVPAGASAGAGLADNKTLLYGGMILAGLGLAWLVSRKA